jgi:hypothetical protein
VPVETCDYPWDASMIPRKFVKEYVSAWKIAWIVVIAIRVIDPNISDVIHTSRITMHKKRF